MLIFGNIMYFSSYLIPKDKNLWIFGAWFGEKYGDNSAFLFEYVNKNHPEIRTIWVTKNEKTFENMKIKNFEVYKMNSFKANLLSLRAGICIFLQNNSSDLNLFVCNKTKKVQLWHGTPLKKIYYDVFSFTLKSKLLHFFFPFIKENFSLIIAPSEEVRNKFSTAFKINKNKIKITGYPRNDGLFEKVEYVKHYYSCIYLPTFRNNCKFDSFQYNFNLDEVEKSLKKMNTHLYVQLHPNDHQNKENIVNIVNNSKFIHIIEFDDINSNLKKFDFLITDYSSVYFDYLLLDRPIIFAPFDYDIYLKTEREFYYDYNKITPGPKAKDWNEVLEYMNDAIEYPDNYKNERKAINKIFNKFNDKNNCQRVFEEIKNL